MSYIQKVEVKCFGSEEKDIDELVALQGELKTLAPDDYEKLKNRILEFGFLEPITIWRDRNEILNGHQRVTALSKMREEGYFVPSIPVNSISVRDKAEAKRVILSLTSQYGRMSEDSLAEFMREAEINIEDLLDDFVFAGIDGDVLEGVIREMEIDTSYTEKYGEEAKEFEELYGKALGKKKHLLLYVEFEHIDDYEYAQSVMGTGKGRKMSPEKFLEVVGAYDDED